MKKKHTEICENKRFLQLWERGEAGFVCMILRTDAQGSVQQLHLTSLAELPNGDTDPDGGEDPDCA